MRTKILSLVSALLICFTAGAFLLVRAQLAPPPNLQDIPEQLLKQSFPKESDLFPRGIHWVGNVPPNDLETLELADVLLDKPLDQFAPLPDRVEEFLQQRPNSAYAPSLRVELAYWYRKTGRFTRALEHWSAAWESSAHFNEGRGKVFADRALVESTALLASLGRLEELEAFIAVHRSRIMSEGHLAQIWDRTLEAAYHMRRKPGLAYRCGTFALNNVNQRLTGQLHLEILQIPSSEFGFTLAELALFSEQHGVKMAAAFREPGSDFLIPSVVHWNQNHYAALATHAGGLFLVEDPTF
jgi:hypothetical protein